MTSDNICNIVGRLGKDPDLRYTQTRKPYCKFSVVCSFKVGKDQEHTDWVPISIWGELAENVAAAVKKGDKVFVRGRYTTSSYESNGQKKYFTQVTADTVAVCIPGSPYGSKDSNHQQQGKPGGNFGQFGSPAPQETSFSDYQQQPQQGPEPGVMGPANEDIPF